MKLKIPKHQVIPAPTMGMIREAASLEGVAVEEAAQRLIARRQRIIDMEERDPLRFGWEPSIWKVADALLGEGCFDPEFEGAIARRFGEGRGWEWWAETMRGVLGFRDPVQTLLVMGCNRSSKSEYAAKRSVLKMTQRREANVYLMHMSNPRSVREQQPLVWKYLPPEWRRQSSGVDEYVKYKRKTGFSEGSFIAPNGSMGAFLNYLQDRDVALEGIEADWVAPDELLPADWLETLIYRMATRAGKIVVTFTPIHGYTPTVQMFCDGGEVMRESIGYMLPTDGGEADPARALGLTADQYDELRLAEKEDRPSFSPSTVPEDCHAWIEGKRPEVAPVGREVVRPFGLGLAQPAAPEGRRFEMMPRVMRCMNRRMAVVWFHACDNPYGGTKTVAEMAVLRGRNEVRIRVYGKATRSVSRIFPKFARKVHVMPAEAIPGEGTNYLFVDPASDRNFFMTWVRSTQEGSYVYREWPGSDAVSGVGEPEPWAVPSGKKEGKNDGARGEGQRSFGWGLLRYKFEIARLEGWEDFARWFRDCGGADEEAAREHVIRGSLYPDEGAIDEWDESKGAAERIEMRFVDSRAASDPRMEKDRPVTLFEDLRELGMTFDLTPGDQIVDGTARINAALDFDQDEEMSFFNRPRLYVCEKCVNTIYSLENWMNVDGEHGACKDPIDNLRYFYTSEAGYVGKDDFKPKGGGWYGRGACRVSGDGGGARGRGGRWRGGGAGGRSGRVGLVMAGVTVRARSRPGCMGERREG